ncbi:MAG TPA: CBS domain-containing protein [Paracoccaceae bacterium]|nr:CBS domain-containing protein [Paracoccaceae bacterium]
MAMKASDILHAKGTEVMTVRPTETLERLSHRLRMARVGALVVSRDGRTIEGIVSERDIVHCMAERGAACLSAPVETAMTRRVITCEPESSIASVMKTMTANRIRHLPVVEGGNLAGIVSLGDVVKARLDEMELEAGVLRDLAMSH